ncbi:endolytic transglycosylase MltG [bacterium]|nr:endolytic transglycosylase MltG [bacterium]
MILIASAAALLAAVMACVILLFVPFRAIPAEIRIERGSSAGRVAALLRENGVIRSETGFRAAVRILGASRRLEAGRYFFESPQSHYRIVSAIRNGRVMRMSVTLPEGMTARRTAGLLSRAVDLDSAAFMAAVRDSAMVRRYGISAASLEGYLFPDTYRFSTSATVDEVLDAMVGSFRRIFTDSMAARGRDMGFDSHQVITLASLVEGEALLDEERPLVAAVYLNRLRIGMALQACPTIQYLLPDGPRRLLNRDLHIESPYNTYLHPGLPPGPVNNPGLASIRAVLNPAPVNYLYMVANGDGSHTFSAGLDGHNRAKQRLNRIRREISRRKG